MGLVGTLDRDPIRGLVDWEAISITCCNDEIDIIFFKKLDQYFICGGEVGSIMVVSNENTYCFDTPIFLFERWYEVIVLQKIF